MQILDKIILSLNLPLRKDKETLLSLREEYWEAEMVDFVTNWFNLVGKPIQPNLFSIVTNDSRYRFTNVYNMALACNYGDKGTSSIITKSKTINDHLEWNYFWYKESLLLSVESTNFNLISGNLSFFIRLASLHLQGPSSNPYISLTKLMEVAEECEPDNNFNESIFIKKLMDTGLIIYHPKHTECFCFGNKEMKKTLKTFTPNGINARESRSLYNSTHYYNHVK